MLLEQQNAQSANQSKQRKAVQFFDNQDDLDSNQQAQYADEQQQQDDYDEPGAQVAESGK